LLPDTCVSRSDEPQGCLEASRKQSTEKNYQQVVAGFQSGNAFHCEEKPWKKRMNIRDSIDVLKSTA
jgi:hypothetical protein